MHDAPPFQPKRPRHNEAIEFGLRSMAERLLVEERSVPPGCDPRWVVFGNFGDVISWDEVCAVYEAGLARRAG